jgi:hypothetical protein
MEDDFDEDEQFERDLEQVKSFFGKYLYEVCPRCRGEGKHVNPSIDSHGLTREDFDQDPDFEEDYFSGVYDVPCYVCSGARVVKAPNWLAFTPDEAHIMHLHLADEADYRALVRSEQFYEDRDYYRGDY